MVLIIENIKKIAIERVNIFDFGEIFKDVEKFFIESLLTEFDFSHIERSNSADSITWMNNSWSLSLGF
jgi:hypothetical protein